MKRMKHLIILIGCMIVWLLLLFIQHLACFDVFDSNLWYLYMIACVAALLQYGILFFTGKHISQKVMPWVGCAVYAFLAVAKVWQLTVQSNFQPSGHIGLAVTCMGLNLVGLAIVLVQLIGFNKAKKYKDN